MHCQHTHTATSGTAAYLGVALGIFEEDWCDPLTGSAPGGGEISHHQPLTSVSQLPSQQTVLRQHLQVVGHDVGYSDVGAKS